MVQLWNDIVRKRPVDCKFAFKSSGVPADNQFFAPDAWPVNGCDDKGTGLSLGVLNFIFAEPVIADAFSAEDFKFVYTNVNGEAKEMTSTKLYVTSFNPTGSSTGASYYALQVYLTTSRDNVDDIGGVPEYNWQNCHVYYKGIYVGRVTLTWYKDPVG